MAIRFKDTISINEEYTFPLEDGTAGQTLQTDGSGNISFSTIGETVKIACKNTSGSTITKGTPVYVTGTVGASFEVEIAPADASNSAKMPAVGLLETDLANNGEGYVVTGGLLKNLTTDPIDGTNTASNDTIYVKAGGGLTMTKPTGSNLIQNIGKVGRVNSANAGSIVVSSILRTNDIPNLTEGKIWVGSANNTIESTVVHIDETNSLVGIGTTSPGATLEVDSTTSFDIAKIGNNSGAFNFGYGTSLASIDLAASHAFRIRQGAVVPFYIQTDGNVGIGTTSPDTITEIVGDNPILTIRDTDTSSSTATATIRFAESGAGDALGNYWDIGYSPVNLLNFDYMGSTKMTIDSTGNLGLGTTSPNVAGFPDATLTIEGGSGSYGAFEIGSLSATASGDRLGEIRFYNKGTTAPYGLTGIRGLRGTNANDSELTFWTSSANSAAERVRIDSSGSVISGYGTTLGNYQFTGSAYKIEGGSGLGDMRFTAPRFRFYDGVGNPTINIASGSVGIGTASPSAKLTLNDAGQQVGIDFKEAGTTRAHIEYDGTVPGLEIGTNAASNVILKTSNTERLRIDGSGVATFTGPVISEGPDGGMVMREWTSDSAYGMIGTANMAGQEYALLTNGTNTYIGSGTGGTTHIRGGANDSYPEIRVDGSQVLVLSGNADTLFAIQGNSTGQYDPVLNFLASGNSITTEGAQIWYDNSVGDLHISTTYASDDADIHFYTRTGTDKGTNNERLTISGNGDVIAAVNMQAPIFYDSDNTAYQVNPAGDTTLSFTKIYSTVPQLAIEDSNNGAGGGAAGLITFRNTQGKAIGIGYTGDETSNSDLIISTNAASTYGGYLGLDAGAILDTQADIILDPKTGVRVYGAIDMTNNDINNVNQLHFNDNVRFYDNGDDSYLIFKYGDTNNGAIVIKDGNDTLKGYVYADSGSFGLLSNAGHWGIRIPNGGSGLELRSANNVEFTVNNDHTLSHGSSRAPIFYDSDNTGYYVDPATLANLNEISVRSAQRWYRPGNNAHQRVDARLDGTDQARMHWYGKDDANTTRNFKHAWYDGTEYVNVTAASNFVYFDRVVNTVSVQADGSFRAPIFYDSGATSYYADFASLSNLNQVNMNGRSSMMYSVSDLNSVNGNVGITGFKGNFGASNMPGSGNYATGIEFTYHDSNARTQLAAASSGSNNTGELWVRSEAWGASSWSSWWKLWHQGNDGASSGLDADLLDGQHGSFYAEKDHIRSLGVPAFTGGTNPTITTAQLISEMESDGAFDSYSSVFKTTWSYAGNYDLSDAGRFTETAGTSWITWTDNSSDSTRGNITALAIAPNTGGSFGKVFVYNDQGSSYSPGWRELWTSGNTIVSAQDISAPIFYDYNATTYYCDPGSRSNLSSLVVGSTGTNTSGYGVDIHDHVHMHNFEINYVSQLHFNDNVRFYDDGNDNYLNFKYGDVAGGGIRVLDGDTTTQGYLYGDGSGGFGLLDKDGHWALYTNGTDQLQLRSNNNVEFYVYNSYTYSPGSSRAPIFYDSNNTGYYTNPASTSRMNQIDGNYYDVEANAAYALRFWSGNQGYSIRMSAATDGTYGGRVAGETTSDYNMYFTMNAGTNRGFVFKGANTTSGAVAGIDASGNGRFIGDVVAYSSSDERLKDNKKNIDNALEKVESLNGIEFDWNDKQDVYSGHDVGVIAQEVEKVLPEIVNTRDTGYKAVKYEKLVPLLIEAVKELSEKVKMLENK